MNSPFIITFFCVLTYLSQRFILRRKSVNYISAFEFTAQLSVTVFVMMYTFIAVTMTAPFTCVKQDSGIYTLFYRPEIECFNEEWYAQLRSIIFYMILYFLFVPFTLVFIYYRNRKDPGNPKFVSKFSGLVAMYKTEYYWWEVVSICRKLSFSLSSSVLAIFFPSYVKRFSVLSILLLFLFIDIHYMPYRNQLNNQSNLM
jgi:hypothetical protein